MSELERLAGEVCETTGDYQLPRGLSAMGPDHVLRWVDQFPARRGIRQRILRELGSVLRHTYISRHRAVDFLRGIAEFDDLTGQDPEDFWRRADLVVGDGPGGSQVELLKLLRDRLQVSAGPRSSGEVVVYLDDVVVTGQQCARRLNQHLRQRSTGPPRLVIVAVFGLHTRGLNHVRQSIETLFPKVSLRFCRYLRFLDHAGVGSAANTYWPSRQSGERSVVAFCRERSIRPWDYRPAGTSAAWPFRSNEGRELLEAWFFKLGIKIQRLSSRPNSQISPLGWGRPPFGPGSPIVTFRNCPNNAPLVLWWGDPSAPSWHPLSQWTPLFPRRTHMPRTP